MYYERCLLQNMLRDVKTYFLCIIQIDTQEKICCLKRQTCSRMPLEDLIGKFGGLFSCVPVVLSVGNGYTIPVQAGP